ncbi:MAG: hypothetical protein Q4P66_10055 [Actinomycetaceae bacterium]|nr:hypothetical protein [Actinomycetaceae bacterium]
MMNLKEFKSLIVEGQDLNDVQLRERVAKNSVISDWEPDRFWDWKKENFETFGNFLVRTIHSFNGSEDIEFVETLLTNLHVVIPQYDENIAQLCILLLEEFVTKQVARISDTLDSAWETFKDSPDFEEDKERILADLNRYRDSLSMIHFSYLDRR